MGLSFVLAFGILTPAAALQDPPAPSPHEVIAPLVEEHYGFMPEKWRQERAGTWSARLDDPSVAPETRTRVLQEFPDVLKSTTLTLDLLRGGLSDRFKVDDLLEEGVDSAVGQMDGLLQNAASVAPLSPGEREKRESELEALKRHAESLIAPTLVGDSYARDLVQDRLEGLFEIYRDEIGSPLRPFLNRALGPEVFEDVKRRMEAQVPKDKRFLLTELTGDPEKDVDRLNELGLEGLIYDVVVLNMYLPLGNASWNDPEALEKVIQAEEAMIAWRKLLPETLQGRPLIKGSELDPSDPQLLAPIRFPKGRDAVASSEAAPGDSHASRRPLRRVTEEGRSLSFTALIVVFVVLLVLGYGAVKVVRAQS